MKISVVTISFNQCRFLKQCIDSVVSQRKELSTIGVDLEYIVVDPGSTDGSRDLIESYGDEIIKIFERDSGPANGLNIGFSNATGDVGCFLNSDDVFMPKSLLHVATAFKDNRDVDVIMGDGYFIDQFGKKTNKIYSTEFSVKNYAYGAISFIQQSIFFKLEPFNRVGGFNEGNGTCWDGELFLDMAISNCKFKLIRKDLGLFRLHEEGITGSGRLTEKYLIDHQRLFKKAMGRDANSLDVIVKIFLKATRLVRNPILFRKLFI